MGWGCCGKDSKGRNIGYYYAARCDEPGCKEKIYRGLAYACGGMHGDNEGCEGYFCPKHLMSVDRERYNLTQGQLCKACLKRYEEEYGPEDEEGE